MLPSLLAFVLLSAVASGPINVGDVTIPEDFFRGVPQQDDTIQLGYTCPSSLEPQTIELENGWWNACAKLPVLMQQDLGFRAAYMAASKDPALAATGVSYRDWSRSSQADKETIRAHLLAVASEIAERYDLPARLAAAAVDPALVAARRAKNEARTADLLGITEIDTSKLVAFCPGAAENVSVNSQHPAFEKFKLRMEQPAAAAEYNTAVRAFSAYLDAHPTASIDERNAELARLLTPILKDLKWGQAPFSVRVPN